MNIQDLPSEILEKILIEGNFLSVSRVCQTWRYHAQKNKFKFNEIFFDSINDDPEKIIKSNPNQLIVFNSISPDENKLDNIQLYNKNIIVKYKKIFKKITSLKTLNFIFDISIYVKSRLNSKFRTFDLFLFIFNAYYLYQKNKILNIEIKYVCENIRPKILFYFEIYEMFNIIDNLFHKYYEKFTIKMPNNNYIIYDKNKKLLIIRFGNYEKYNFPMTKIAICRECNKYNFVICSNNDHKQYHVNSFYDKYKDWLYNLYPASLICVHYGNLTKNVEKLIIISSEFHDFMFDQLLKTSKNQKEKEIEYHCLNPNKKKLKRKNFKFVPVEKEKEQEYTFEQMHFKYFGENVF